MRAQRGSGSLFIAWACRFAAAGDELAGEPPYCGLQGNVARLGMTARASGREGTAPGPGGEPGWLGRRCTAQGCRAAAAASAWPAGRGEGRLGA